MIRIAQAANPLDARHILGILESHGIRAVIQGEALWAARGELPFTPDSAPSVWVTDEADAQSAREILAEHAAPANPSHCKTCGHDLRGLSEPTCPNCKTPFRRVGTWTCPDCHEHIGTQFTNCWSCGRERGDIAETPSAIPPDAPANSTPCTLCKGTGRIDQMLLPAALAALGAFMAYAALHNIIQESSFTSSRADLLVGRFLFAISAATCFFFAARLRRTPCICNA